MWVFNYFKFVNIKHFKYAINFCFTKKTISDRLQVVYTDKISTK